MPTVGVVLVAAGSGTRLGRGVPKVLVEVSGTSILERSLVSISRFKPKTICVAAPIGFTAEVQAILKGSGVIATVVEGGQTRMASVSNALAKLEDVDVVLIHDSARPETPVEVFERVAALVEKTGDGVVPVLPTVDTTVIVEEGVITEAVDRDTLFRVQTPQGFPAAEYRSAISATLGNFTDDASVWRAHGGTVRTVAGDEKSLKITTERDLTGFVGPDRVGIGTDTHAFSDSTKLRLGLLEWRGEPGLAGHSDGDVVAHALCDALLSAAGIGDLGSNFGTDDPVYAGESGDVFLRETLKRVRSAGFEPLGASVQVVATKPKIGPRRAEMEDALTSLLGFPVTVSATTTDGLGFTGEGKGITAVAVAHLSNRSA